MDLEKVKLTISENQFDKLRRGHQIQVSKAKLKNGKHSLYVNPDLAKKIKKAKRANKGVRIMLSQEELEMSAEGLKDFLKKAKKWYDKHLKKTVAPILKKGVNKLGNIALSEAELLAPELAPVLEKGRKFIPKATDKIGELTGAYGVGGSFKPAGGNVSPQLKTESNYNTMLNPMHPARWNPAAAQYAPGVVAHCGGCTRCMEQLKGGSFKPAGGYVKY